MVQQPNVLLRDATGQLIMGALGVNRRLFDGDGASSESAYRGMVSGICQHLAVLLEREIGVKLERPLTLDLSPASGYDVRGIGRAVGALVNAGVPLDSALRIAGVKGSRLVRS